MTLFSIYCSQTRHFLILLLSQKQSATQPLYKFPLSNFLSNIENLVAPYGGTPHIEKLRDNTVSTVRLGPFFHFYHSILMLFPLQPLARMDSTERLFSGPQLPVFKGVNCDVEEFLKVDDVTFARQLTLVEHEMQRSSHPSELLKRVFGNKQHLARDTPGITAIVEHFYRISQVATTLVVKAKKLADRVEVLRKLINIATVSHLWGCDQGFFVLFLLISIFFFLCLSTIQLCRKMNNFNSMSEIIAGLHVTAVYRLKRTWAVCRSSVLLPSLFFLFHLLLCT